MTAISLLFGQDGWGGLLLQGALVTILLALCTMPLGFGFGLALAVMKRSSSKGVRAFCEIYTTFFRGIPDLLALFIVYFGLQIVLDRLGKGFNFHLELNAFAAGVIALGTIAAAYSSEVWVSALQSVPKGQEEAATSLGLDRSGPSCSWCCRNLFRVAIPGLGNVWSILLKDTSLMSTIAVMDLMRAASEASRGARSPILFFSAAAGIYLVFSIASNAVQSRLEQRSNRGYA